jgi:subtilisin family serine protease
MTDTYTVLRDLTPRSRDPFDEGFGPRGVDDAPAEVRIDNVELTKNEVLDLTRSDDVTAIAPVMPTALVRPVSDEEARASADDPAPGGVAWGITAVGADTSRWTGDGVTVAVLDTGIDSAHPAFVGVELVEEDFSGSGSGDRQGHGSHCAGTVFGRDVDGTRIGVARGVTKALIGKVLSDDGTGDSDMLFRGMQWAVQQGARVISMSLGFDFPGLVERLTKDGWPTDLATSRALEAYRANLRMFDAIMRMIAAQEEFTGGAVVVAASGNESKRAENPDHEIGVSIPAAADDVLSTGALGRSPGGFVVAPFSNTFPRQSGPGVDVLSADAGGRLVSLNGTSMATPHAAGVAALWWQEVAESQLPTQATTVAARMLANADISGLAPDVDVADRGVGMVRAPQ